MAYIALGSNLGSRELTIHAALARIGSLPGTHVRRVATLRETEPVNAPRGSGRFINTAAALDTTLEPLALLRALLQIEVGLGRDRTGAAAAGGGANVPRIIDLDLLLHDDVILNMEELILPHPRMHERRFVLEPLVEIAAMVVHPAQGKTIQQLFNELPQLRADAMVSERN